MIFDHRTYVCKPGLLKAHVELYAKHGYATQSRHLGPPLMWATTEVGDVNSYVHIWSYQDMADRTARRAKMWADPDWLAYVKLSGELGALVHQENKILISAPFVVSP
jgi:hypothetical protein